MQVQVILKPPPENVQELYLESLAAIGIDLRQHDIKFEEDNWEAPTLSAWGVGWQMNCNSRFTTSKWRMWRRPGSTSTFARRSVRVWWRDIRPSPATKIMLKV